MSFSQSMIFLLTTFTSHSLHFLLAPPSSLIERFFRKSCSEERSWTTLLKLLSNFNRRTIVLFSSFRGFLNLASIFLICWYGFTLLDFSRKGLFLSRHVFAFYEYLSFCVFSVYQSDNSRVRNIWLGYLSEPRCRCHLSQIQNHFVMSSYA